MNLAFRWRVLVLAVTLGVVCGSAHRALAQTESAPDLASRIDTLEKELADLRSQMEAQKAAAAAPAAAMVPAATPAAAPAPTGLAGLLGPTTLSGFVDVYYDYNSNQPASRTTAFRNFDINSGQFGLNMIELVADKAPDAAASRVGYHVALGFGQAMNAVNYNELGFDQYLKEGYLEYLAPVGKGLQINVGKFVTPAGGEVIETKDNWNYSRGLLFTLAIPYFHFGASAKYAFNPKFALTGYLVNGWNNSVDNNSGKTTGFSAAWTPNSKFGLVQNYLVGPEQNDENSDFRHLFDTVVTYSLNSKVSLMANYDYGQDHPGGVSAHWSGIAGYIKYAPNDKWALATRGEYFSDNGGNETGQTQKLSEFTFTLQRMLASKLMTRLEFRRDMSDQNVFPDHLTGLKDAQNTVTVGMVYAFSSADAK
jgi:Putative beta-barrel porin-2, OmpL-like. bbp2